MAEVAALETANVHAVETILKSVDLNEYSINDTSSNAEVGSDADDEMSDAGLEYIEKYKIEMGYIDVPDIEGYMSDYESHASEDSYG